ncbi:MAG: helix-turn-helix domain-containing protein [Serpentinimonas sp.]|nr:helix-turn-helix domain-containing protein [Serpentinimonas sp.]
MEQLYTPQQLAASLGIAVQTLYNRRSYSGSLPQAVHIGRLVRYRQSDVDAWLSGLSRHPMLRDTSTTAPKADTPIRKGRPTKAEQVMRRGRH